MIGFTATFNSLYAIAMQWNNEFARYCEHLQSNKIADFEKHILPHEREDNKS